MVVKVHFALDDYFLSWLLYRWIYYLHQQKCQNVSYTHFFNSKFFVAWGRQISYPQHISSYVNSVILSTLLWRHFPIIIYFENYPISEGFSCCNKKSLHHLHFFMLRDKFTIFITSVVIILFVLQVDDNMFAFWFVEAICCNVQPLSTQEVAEKEISYSLSPNITV